MILTWTQRVYDELYTKFELISQFSQIGKLQVAGQI